MTAAGTPAASRPLPTAGRPGLAAARLLRLELRRSTMLWVLPVLAALLAYTEVRNDLSHPPLWAIRSTVLQHQLELIGAVVAGVAAWTAGRDKRRNLTDLVTATARPRWARQLAAWAGVTGWSMLLYAASVAVVFGVTARQATWGGPIWWLPGVAAGAIVASSAVGFALGSFFPSRFTPPLVAIGAVLAPEAGVLALQRHQTWGRVSPAEDATVPGTGIFFPFHAGLSIVQIMFLAGLTAAALGVLALPAAAGDRWLRRVGAMIALTGLAVAAAGLALAGTARQGAEGIVIPALHADASDRPLSYTPACDDSSAIPVCLHPAYRAMLPALAAVLGPLLSQVAGLPGAPVRVQLGRANPASLNAAANSGSSNGAFGVTGELTISGQPPVLYLSPLFLLGMQQCPVADCFTAADFTTIIGVPTGVTIVQTVIYSGLLAGQPGHAVANPAQRAIATALLFAGGLSGQRGLPAPPPGSPVLAAAHRFAALPAPARHAWLAGHLAALRAGQITLAEIP